MRADISVVIAAYNVEQTIERAIRSALDQQGASVEVIVVNDGSTDGTADIVAQIDDPRVKLVGHATNKGPGAARNVGFSLATAAWIAVLDGDDSFAPDRLAKCLHRAKAVDADIVVDNLEVHREEDGEIYPMFEPTGFARITLLDLETFIDGNRSFLGGSALGYLKPVFSAKFFKQHNLKYDPDVWIGEDYLLLADALAYGARCVVEPTAGYRYTVRAGSVSHRLTQSDVERITEGDRKFLARHKLPPAAAKAQQRREKALREAFAFTNLINALKGRNIAGTVKAVLTRPLVIRHLWRPVGARMGRIFGRPRK